MPSIKELLESDIDLCRNVLWPVVWKSKRILGYIDLEAEHYIMDAGSGFFIQPNIDQTFFVMTYHQYKSLSGLAAGVMYDGMYKDKDIKHRVKFDLLCIFDFRENCEHGKTHLISKEHDIVLIPTEHLQSDKKGLMKGNEFGIDTFCLINFNEKELKAINATMMFAGFPNETNGSRIYSHGDYCMNCELSFSDNWCLTEDEISIEITSYAQTKLSYDDSTQGLSGCPIFMLQQEKGNLFSLSILGVTSYRSIGPFQLHGPTMYSILNHFKIKADKAYIRTNSGFVSQ